MRKTFLIFATILMISQSVCSQNRCPISSATTKISYHQSTNSGVARYTSFVLYEDSLVWTYTEARNNCSLSDVCRYDKNEFLELVNKLSAIRFSVQTVKHHPIGGGGYSFSFEDRSGRYLLYGNFDKLTGDYRQVSSLIQSFIDTHRTKGESLFRELSAKPHTEAKFGEFLVLPKDLEKYRVE